MTEGYSYNASFVVQDIEFKHPNIHYSLGKSSELLSSGIPVEAWYKVTVETIPCTIMIPASWKKFTLIDEYQYKLILINTDLNELLIDAKVVIRQVYRL